MFYLSQQDQELRIGIDRYRGVLFETFARGKPEEIDQTVSFVRLECAQRFSGSLDSLAKLRDIELAQAGRVSPATKHRIHQDHDRRAARHERVELIGSDKISERLLQTAQSIDGCEERIPSISTVENLWPHSPHCRSRSRYSPKPNDCRFCDGVYQWTGLVFVTRCSARTPQLGHFSVSVFPMTLHHRRMQAAADTIVSRTSIKVTRHHRR